ncbi:hypothetical protein R5W24_001679 [Gemmata sp. JC717]|uniref:Uncharacterized protein n=1 Tax=Gemmata algarum TaxID=2975278 RepID=A0ABU5ER15_9BACT|nr:hypothetical protein [Gemmata algarum]MDY3552593.1 hypothetical protein [Gemmata algarum]MDY3557665.1 hypothetical protein [Gemmata algarum]
MSDRARSVVPEPDELAAPLVFLYLFGVLACLGAALAWVYHFRGYA